MILFADPGIKGRNQLVRAAILARKTVWPKQLDCMRGENPPHFGIELLENKVTLIALDNEHKSKGDSKRPKE